jgi:hypothetical protein
MNNTIHYNITISQPLLTFLQETTDDSNRFNKYEAYVYLLESAAEAVPQSDSHLHRGQFVTSFSELAEVWNWHRGNVRLFLSSLENLGALTLDRQGKSTIITLPLSFEGEANPVRLVDVEERQWLRFLFGMAALDEFLSIFDAAMLQTEEALAELADPEAPLAGEIGSRLRLLLNHLMLRSTNILPSDQRLDTALRELFVDECHSDLQQLLALLSIGGFSVVGNASDEPSPYKVTENAMSRLHEVISYYAPWLEQPLNANAPDRDE